MERWLWQFDAQEVPEDAAQHFAQLKQQLLMAEQQLKEFGLFFFESVGVIWLWVKNRYPKWNPGLGRSYSGVSKWWTPFGIFGYG